MTEELYIRKLQSNYMCHTIMKKRVINIHFIFKTKMNIQKWTNVKI